VAEPLRGITSDGVIVPGLFAGTADDEPFYYRIHSPVVLVELDQQPGVVLDTPEPSRHHIHTIIRTPNGGDYGADLLARHHARFDHSLSEQAAT
jgi:hypothetical protein